MTGWIPRADAKEVIKWACGEVNAVSDSENRLKTGRFAPGNCANPGGRPKKTELERKADALFRDKSLKAAETLIAMAEDTETPAKIRVEICKYILDRALGKPKACGEFDVAASVITPAGILKALDENERRTASGNPAA